MGTGGQKAVRETDVSGDGRTACLATSADGGEAATGRSARDIRAPPPADST